MIYIGIDPDLTKSGYAIYDSIKKELTDYGAKGIVSLIDMLRKYQTLADVHIILEAGWLIPKSNFHYVKNSTANIREKIAKNVGTNHAIGKVIEEFLKSMNLSYNLQVPLGKKSVELTKSATKKIVKNQDIRDAIWLVWGK